MMYPPSSILFQRSDCPILEQMATEIITASSVKSFKTLLSPTGTACSLKHPYNPPPAKTHMTPSTLHPFSRLNYSLLLARPITLVSFDLYVCVFNHDVPEVRIIIFICNSLLKVERCHVMVVRM